MCEKEIQVQECKKCLIEEIKWPKEEKDSSSFLKAEMTTSESPSTIKEGRLRSIAKVTVPLKALGPDGMPSIFYQSYWDLLGEDVTSSVLHFLKHLIYLIMLETP